MRRAVGEGGAGLCLAYSKNRITPETIPLPLALADQRGLHESIAAMFPRRRIIPELQTETEPRLAHDSSTNALIRRYHDVHDESEGK